jgi:ribosomal-protein-serine acetyltransferase
MVICRVDADTEIRLLEERHAAELLALSEGYDSRPQTNEWFYAPCDMEGTRRFIRGGLDRLADGKGLWAGVWHGGDLAGVIGLTVRAPGATATIDYALGPAFRGRGIMTEACRALISYAFEELKLNRIEITPDVKNVKSCAIPERLGLRKEGILREAVSYGDFYGDLALYAVLRKEWESR